MRNLLLAVIFAIMSTWGADVAGGSKAKTKVLVITGGHGFEEKPFFEMFSQNAEITHTHAPHGKESSTAYDREDLYSFDVVVLYDMVQKITPEQQARFKGLIERGIGLVVLHHAIVNYQSWPEFERIIGGTYPEPQDKRGVVNEALGYEHDVEFVVKVFAKDHPVTSGLKDFTVEDEIYWGYRTAKDVTPLLTTTHPKSGKPLSWARSEGKSRVIYIQPGHGPHVFKDASYQKLLAQAIRWTAKGGK